MAARPILYYALFSPPSRACLLTSKLIGLNLELKPINFASQENKSDWFLKINSRHTVPVLADQGVHLCDSHAIITYLVGQYGQEQHASLYPHNLLQRAVVDERLYYENGMLFQVVKDFASKIFYGDEIKYPRENIDMCHNAYAFLEEFLTNGKYVTGEQMTLADISINTSLITLNKLVNVEQKRYPKIILWMERMRHELPEYQEINEKGAQQLHKRLQDALEENMTRHT